MFMSHYATEVCKCPQMHQRADEVREFSGIDGITVFDKGLDLIVIRLVSLF